jgi:predicted acylesterase/phospholipase RssA
LFDIVAGTSIGAMNAAVLVSNVVKKDKTWSEAVGELERFWKEGIALEEGVNSSEDIVPVGIFESFHGGNRGQSNLQNGHYVQRKL